MSTHSRWDLTAPNRDASAVTAGYRAERLAIDLGQMIYDRRTALGMTQVQLAELTGITQPALSRLERGGALPTVETLERIAEAFEADLVVSFTPHAA